MADIEVATEADYEAKAIKAPGPIVVKFGSKTCGPCLLLSSALKDLSPDYGDEVRFLDVDVEESPAIAKRYGIVTIPVLLFMRGGEVRHRTMGNLTRGKLSQLIDAHIDGGQ
ncbi:MAG TPA: thioredoxin family protein [Rhodocyclaceae bacterium]|nr:thioredoxin family protein [Rhodocyclaceae bacterium]